MTDQSALTEAAFRHFSGSEHRHWHALVRGAVLKDATKYVADHGGTYWLLDEAAHAQRHEKPVAGEEFQVWTLAVKLDRAATLRREDGCGWIVF